VHNTTDKPKFNIDARLHQMLVAKGFQFAQAPESAHYLVQVNVLQVGKADPKASMQTLSGSFGAPLNGVLSGAATVAALSGHVTGRQLGVAGLVGGAADFLADSMVKDVVYTAITDVQISERTQTPITVTGDEQLAQGNSAVEHARYHSQSSWHR